MKRFVASTGLLVLVALGLAAAVWDGSAIAGVAGDFPGDGLYGACNSFPRDTSVTVTNLENGKTVSVRLKVDPFPSDTTNIGGILVYANDPTYSGQYSWMAFPTDNGWHTYTLDMTQPPFAVDPTKIIQFTVELASASAPTEDAGVLSFSPITVTAYIDTITVQ